VVVSDASIRNNITISIAHVHLYLNKTIYHAVNITSTEAELFAIRCSINQTVQIPDVAYIIVVIDVMYAAYHIFNSSIYYSYQHQSIAILKELSKFFNKDSLNSIKFLDCPSNDNWLLYLLVDKETKVFNLILLLSYKSSWDFERKIKCDNILKTWKMMFQASYVRGRYFFDLLDNDLHIIESLYSKEGLWIKYFSHSNFLYVRTTRAIINHAPIEEYHLCFFLNKDFSCLCGNYPIKTRYHILHKCKRFNKYWNPR